jgi:adenylate kinase family enzyme
MVAGDEWIIDGNYGSTLELRVRKADWVVFFDFPRWRCFVGVLRRRFNRRAERPDMAPGCPERLNREFVRFVWRFPSVGRRRVVDALVDLPPGAEVGVVRSRRDVERVLASWPVTAYQLALAADRDRAVASLGDLKLGCGTMLGG